MTERPDFSELIKSPYDDDGTPRLRPPGWALVPVVALVVGVLAGLMVARMQSGEDVAQPASTTSTTMNAPEVPTEPATGFPDGYTPVSDSVAVRVLTTYETEGESYVVVAGVTLADADRTATFMQSFTDWILQQPGGELAASGQVAQSGSPGIITIRFPGPIGPDAVLTATPVEPGTTTTVRLFDDAPEAMVVDQPIPVVVADEEIVVDFLEYGLDDGYAAWYSPTGVSAEVSIVVTLLGTEGLGPEGLPIRIGSFNSTSQWLGQDARTEVPSWATHGEMHLFRSGPFRFDQDLIKEITVDLVAVYPTDPQPSVAIPIG
ncbi:MAG: hypothetical protein KDB69_07815 [Acidimicrobiia bacterium]|nr:hypothetical protein [Acidimicrobiia bacterium]